MNRARRSIRKRDFTDPVTPCFSSLDLCNNGTNSCSGNGTCTLAKQSGVILLFFFSSLSLLLASTHSNKNNFSIFQELQCFRCKCTSQYTGNSCEFIDIVAPFHIIFWLSLTFIIVLFLVSYSLAYMDPGTDTLLFKTVTPKAKRE